MNPRSFGARNRHTSGTIEAQFASPALDTLPAETPESVPSVDVMKTEGVGLSCGGIRPLARLAFQLKRSAPPSRSLGSNPHTLARAGFQGRFRRGTERYKKAQTGTNSGENVLF
jgi:hypothetical protein